MLLRLRFDNSKSCKVAIFQLRKSNTQQFSTATLRPPTLYYNFINKTEPSACVKKKRFLFYRPPKEERNECQNFADIYDIYQIYIDTLTDCPLTYNCLESKLSQSHLSKSFQVRAKKRLISSMIKQLSTLKTFRQCLNHFNRLKTKQYKNSRVDDKENSINPRWLVSKIRFKGE